MIGKICIIHLRLYVIRNPLPKLGNISVHAWYILSAAHQRTKTHEPRGKPVDLLVLDLSGHDGPPGVPVAGVLSLLASSAELVVDQFNLIRFEFVRAWDHRYRHFKLLGWMGRWKNVKLKLSRTVMVIKWKFRLIKCISSMNIYIFRRFFFLYLLLTKHQKPWGSPQS